MTGNRPTIVIRIHTTRGRTIEENLEEDEHLQSISILEDGTKYIKSFRAPFMDEPDSTLKIIEWSKGDRDP